ncbi:hypothetical protein [Maliponia aquimaris]|uniref:Uncharacterized protein n=1 Tax=Maliponia aquimaris TaxID=1673631 RepID=A0A238K194_9RHOB|nr:hypothetical protein [Maliponia aquimaris]SMX36124.1 hypothetical protein MAA8898_00760 [Maliponia aquimaris]
MMPLFQPDLVVLGFLIAKKFVYLEVLAVLAAIRVLAARGAARGFALLALLAALAGVATILAPAAGLTSGPLYVSAARFMSLGSGMVPLLTASALLLLSALAPGARWRWIDRVHVAMLLVFLGLWWWTT